MIGDDLVRLVELTARLRDPVHGCPWDLAQDHVSLRPFVVEEAYEVVAAIDARVPEALAAELGDLLLQVLLHSRLAEETGEFTLHDVMVSLEAKLVRRHPHVFGDAPKDLGLGSIREQWDETKAAERQHKTALPTLLAARKLVVGLRDPSALSDLAKSPDRDVQAGAALLHVIERTWDSGVDPDIALRKAMDRIEAAGGDCGA
ncbi:MAG: MazG nucleotide pyrophosphohydrolase domain-containing protein [bacterium]